MVMETPDAEQTGSGAWCLRVERCHAQGDLAGALDAARGALAKTPADPLVRHTLGVLYLAAKRAKEAVTEFDYLLRHDRTADRHFDLAVALEATGDFTQAGNNYRQALQLEPLHFKARLNLCALLLQLRLPEAAKLEARLLVDAHPQVPDAWCSLGHALFANFDPLAADNAFARAQALGTGHLPAVFGRVVAQAMCGELASALQLLAQLQALELSPEVVRAIPQARETLDLSPAALEDIYLTALFERFRRGEWECLQALEKGLNKLASAVRNDPGRKVPSVHAFNALSIGIDYDDYRVLARQVAAQDAVAFETVFRYPRRVEGEPRRRLRLGFISPAFRDHPSAYLIRNTFRAHDREHFSVSAYCIGWDDGSEVRQDIIDGCDSFVSLAGLDDRAAAQRIHDDGIDILVQFQGFFEGTRNGILQMRPAPVRVAHIGVVGALDATYIDYQFCEAQGDKFDDPGNGAFEKRVRFKELYSPYGAPDAPWSIAVTRRDCGLPADAFVFCSFNNDYKINEELFLVWLEILRATPASVLWLGAGNDGLWQRCVACATKHGIAAERLIRARHCPNNQHLARLRLADLFLDAFAYNAHTTALDALWMGLPIITKEGDRPASSLCAVFLRHLGMNELITRTTEEYVAGALALAKDKAGRQATVKKLMLARTASRVFDTAYKVRLYEHAYATMWARHSAGLPPVGFDVPVLDA